MITAEAERDLWISVLWRAAWDYHRAYLPYEHETVRKLIEEEARKWFYDQRTSVGSFLWIANSLDMDPDLLRKRLLEEAASHIRQNHFTDVAKMVMPPLSIAV